MLITIALVLKLSLCIYKRIKKSALKAFFSFYFGYLLTAFQVVFYYNAINSLIPGLDTTSLNMTIYFIIARNTLFSLVLNVHTASYL